jgi:TATA-box binding protein (TBP) (component of TFIID and TFIIIB)
MEPTIIQKLKKQEKDDISLAEKYYTILSAINNLKLTPREIQLVAFTAIKGNISYASNREEFCKNYDTTGPTINNIISKLKKINVLVKDGSKVKVNNVIVLDFKKDITLEIKLTHG